MKKTSEIFLKNAMEIFRLTSLGAGQLNSNLVMTCYHPFILYTCSRSVVCHCQFLCEHQFFLY